MDFASYIIVDDETGVCLMKLIGRLKKQVDSTTDMSEKRRFIEKAGLKLTDDELSMVGEYGMYKCDKGHSFIFADDAPSKCPTCQSTVFYKV